MNDLSPIRNRLASLALLALAFNLAGSAEPAPQFTHPRDITNRYLPLGTLQRDVLESRTGRIERTAKPELRKTIRFGGQTLEALVVEDREFENGKLVEVALDYFAQADDGTVYYLGEDVNEYKDGKIVSHSGAWLLGKDTERPGILMPAHPRVGDKFRSEDVPKITWEEDKVVSVSETVTVPAGTYRDCVKIKERLSDGSIEYKYCAPGVGCVKEEEADTVFLLRSHTAHAAKASSAKAGSQANPTTLPSTAGTGSGGQNPPLQDPLAGAALSYVGADPYAEIYWYDAINDPNLSAHERQDLIEDLNEDGLSDPQHPTQADLPLIVNRLLLIEAIAANAMDQVNADAFAEAYKDLANMYGDLTRR